MPYFLKAPLSMATNSGDCNSDTDGTDTLTTLSADSAAKVPVGGASKPMIRMTPDIHQ